MVLKRNKRKIADTPQKKNFTYYYNLRERESAVRFGDLPLFDKKYNENFQDPSTSIVIDLSMHKVLSKDDIFKHLDHICKKNIIKVLSSLPILF